MTGPVLTAVDLRKGFGAGDRAMIALDGVSLQVGAGAVTGLIGPDGSGKTTFMRLAVGLLLPDAGRISCLGLDLSSQSGAVQGAVGYMPQRFGLYEDLSVRENLDLYADLQGLPLQERPERYAALLSMTGLGVVTGRLAGRLSGGMKQKLGLACTLLRPPRLLLLDEPTVGVDPLSRRELWRIVQGLVERERMSVLLSTAYLDEAERCADVILLHQGRVIGQGPPSSFSAPLRGRVFLVTGPTGQRRPLQARLSRQPGVRDALLQGDAVRVVTDSAEAPDCTPLGPSVSCAPAQPCFEDGFIDRLKPRTEQPADLQPLDRRRSAAPGATAAAIEVDHLSKRFGSFTAVDAVSFSVRAGEVFGLLGANGAGKTTTFRMLCGLLPPTSGRLSVAGVDLRRAPAAARARIGYMSQRFSLYAGLSVTQNLRFFGRAYGLGGRRLRQRIHWALGAFALADLADAESGTLSLGYRQRLAMASALLHAPDILFLDEPTSGVDPLARREFWGRINALAEGGITVLVTTHFMQEAEYCDRLAIMAAGALLAEGSPTQIREQVRAAPGAATGPVETLEDAFIALIQARPQTGTGDARPG
ncbi:ABC transporter ATP-binding protein [Thiohalocapsa marina]|uniref:ABC transporter ATP-binding protein n=1 Tax=Thiohalocapsa marina TaxID=424902 RepID=A0A5M8FJY5_9GAMM|nr:ATP-binding cassette domain-containing protein [Thiohalocapsa marina]KAA6183501.1 ABC transporter ATP-binding protein [Thiohalocapsa marina]